MRLSSADRRQKTDPSATGPERAPAATLNRDVLIVTAAVWAGHLALIVVRSLVTGVYADPGSLSARAASSVVAALATYAIHLVLDRAHVDSAAKRFTWAIILSVPACLLLVFCDEWFFMLLSPSYRMAHKLIERSEIIFDIVFFVWIFVAWASIYASTFHNIELRERDRRIALAETTVQKARLAALRLQISPHFLFNTLNALAGLIALDRKQQAAQMVANLADHMRHTLEAAPVDFVPLAEEVASQVTYLEIEKVRFADRLAVEIDIAPDAARALVPTLIVQPLIENAIKHGVDPTSQQVVVAIGARVAGEELRVWVDNSHADPGHRAASLGIGLANVRDRLRILFDGRARLECGPAAGGGWRSEIVMPFQAAGEAATA